MTARNYSNSAINTAKQIGLGMEGKKLKISVQTKGRKTEEWLETVLGMLKGLQNVKKETIASS